MTTKILQNVMLCNALNEYFYAVGPELAKCSNPSGEFAFKKYLQYNSKNSMFCSCVTPEEIIKIIYSFPNNKAPGMDNISSKILKKISNSITFPLTFIFNLSFTTGVLPDLLKIAKVIPVHKKGEKNLPGNYRPISLLSVFDKILEKLMHK